MGLISWYDVTSIGYLSVQKTLERVARNVWFHEGGKKKEKRNRLLCSAYILPNQNQSKEPEQIQ